MRVGRGLRLASAAPGSGAHRSGSHPSGSHPSGAGRPVALAEPGTAKGSRVRSGRRAPLWPRPECPRIVIGPGAGREQGTGPVLPSKRHGRSLWLSEIDHMRSSCRAGGVRESLRRLLTGCRTAPDTGRSKKLVDARPRRVTRCRGLSGGGLSPAPGDAGRTRVLVRARLAFPGAAVLFCVRVAGAPATPNSRRPPT